jgi:hypothetical protein
MYELMTLQMTLLREWFTTHITGKRMLPTVYGLKFIQGALVKTKWKISAYILIEETMSLKARYKWCKYVSLQETSSLTNTITHAEGECTASSYGIIFVYNAVTSQ